MSVVERLHLILIDPAGMIVDGRAVERRALTFRLSLRTGCFCNPGAGEAAFDLSQEVLSRAFKGASQGRLPERFQDEEGMSWDAILVDLGVQNGRAVRISLGVVTNFADVYRLVQFALLPWEHC